MITKAQVKRLAQVLVPLLVGIAAGLGWDTGVIPADECPACAECPPPEAPEAPAVPAVPAVPEG